MSSQYEQLLECLPAFRKSTILVLSDEYPPETVGGAEISLHELLKGFSVSQKILVVKFTSHKRDALRFYRHEGIEVLVLPYMGVWKASPLITPFAFINRMTPYVLNAKRAIGYAKTYGLGKARRSAIKLFMSGAKVRGGLLKDGFEEAYHERSTFLAEIVTQLRPRIIIANNSRSMMLYHYAAKRMPGVFQSIKSIGIVRDNRFKCARHDQTVVVNQRRCTSCDYSCAKLDVNHSHQDQVNILEQTRSQRLKALVSFSEIIVTSQFLKTQIRQETSNIIEPKIVPNSVGNVTALNEMIEGLVEIERPIISIIGSVNEAKGQLSFIRASLDQLKKRPDLEIHIIGRGKRTEELITNMLEAENIRSQVVFRGFLSRQETFRIIRSSKVVILPSLWPEPFGRVPLEAGFCERPVVAFKGGAYAETIVDGKTGFLVNYLDYKEMWSRINLLLEDNGLCEKMGAEAYKFICENYSQENSLAQFRRVITKT